MNYECFCNELYILDEYVGLPLLENYMDSVKRPWSSLVNDVSSSPIFEAKLENIFCNLLYMNLFVKSPSFGDNVGYSEPTKLP